MEFARRRKRSHGSQACRVNLLRGTTTQMIEMLKDLTDGEKSPPELLNERDWWRSRKTIIRWLSLLGKE